MGEHFQELGYEGNRTGKQRNKGMCSQLETSFSQIPGEVLGDELHHRAAHTLREEGRPLYTPAADISQGHFSEGNICDGYQLWMKNTACHISKQRMLQPSSHHIIVTPTVSTEEIQDGGRMPPQSSSQSCSHPWQCTLRWENAEYWSQIPEVHIKGMIWVSPDSCIFPYTEKH